MVVSAKAGLVAYEAPKTGRLPPSLALKNTSCSVVLEDTISNITLEYCDVKLEKATKLVLQPHLVDFLDFEHQKADFPL